MHFDRGALSYLIFSHIKPWFLDDPAVLGLFLFIFFPLNWLVFFYQETYVLLLKKCYSQQGRKTWPVFTLCFPLLISLSFMLFAPPLLPPSPFLPWFLSFSLTLPQSYIKSYQPLEENIKVLGPVKSYKLSALSLHAPTSTPKNFLKRTFIYSDKLGSGGRIF